MEGILNEENFLTWLHEHLHWIWIILFIYIITVYALHRWMRNKPPVKMNPIVLSTYNFLFGTVNLVIFCNVTPDVLLMIWKFGWRSSVCQFEHNVSSGMWTSVIIFSKFLWLLDIVFFILKKKTMTPFRLYHHVALLMFVWWVCATRQGLMRWLIMINSFTTISFYAVPVFISNNPLATRMFMLYMVALSFLEVNDSKVGSACLGKVSQNHIMNLMITKTCCG